MCSLGTIEAPSLADSTLELMLGQGTQVYEIPDAFTQGPVKCTDNLNYEATVGNEGKPLPEYISYKLEKRIHQFKIDSNIIEESTKKIDVTIRAWYNGGEEGSVKKESILRWSIICKVPPVKSNGNNQGSKKRLHAKIESINS